MLKKMHFCGSSNVIHNDLKGHKQLYKCKDCSRQFVGVKRRDKSKGITDYIEGKQTMEQLAVKYKVSSKTIARDLSKRSLLHPPLDFQWAFG